MKGELRTNLKRKIMKIDKHLRTDIDLIKSNLSTELIKVALFGSCIKSFPDANDIDIALFLKPHKVEVIKQKLLKLNLHHSINPKRINTNYGGGGGSPKSLCKVKEFDFLLLDNSRSNDLFYSKNPKVVFL